MSKELVIKEGKKETGLSVIEAVKSLTVKKEEVKDLVVKEDEVIEETTENKAWEIRNRTHASVVFKTTLRGAGKHQFQYQIEESDVHWHMKRESIVRENGKKSIVDQIAVKLCENDIYRTTSYDYTFISRGTNATIDKMEKLAGRPAYSYMIKVSTLMEDNVIEHVMFHKDKNHSDVVELVGTLSITNNNGIEPVTMVMTIAKDMDDNLIVGPSTGGDSTLELFLTLCPYLAINDSNVVADITKTNLLYEIGRKVLGKYADKKLPRIEYGEFTPGYYLLLDKFLELAIKDPDGLSGTFYEVMVSTNRLHKESKPEGVKEEIIAQIEEKKMFSIADHLTKKAIEHKEEKLLIEEKN